MFFFVNKMYLHLITKHNAYNVLGLLCKNMFVSRGTSGITFFCHGVRFQGGNLLFSIALYTVHLSGT